jgi:hypothetical protein
MFIYSDCEANEHEKVHEKTNKTLNQKTELITNLLTLKFYHKYGSTRFKKI